MRYYNFVQQIRELLLDAIGVVLGGIIIPFSVMFLLVTAAIHAGMGPEIEKTLSDPSISVKMLFWITLIVCIEIVSLAMRLSFYIILDHVSELPPWLYLLVNHNNIWLTGLVMIGAWPVLGFVGCVMLTIINTWWICCEAGSRWCVWSYKKYVNSRQLSQNL